ncbi:MAG: DUF3822 family protein, partial [Bacteroidota bacterium]
MGVTRYDIIEDTFQPEKSASYELSILAGMDSSSYLLLDQNKTVLGLRGFTHEPAEQWWSKDSYLQHTYQKIRVASLGQKFTLVPDRLFNPDERQQYLQDLTNLTTEEAVIADLIPELDVVLVYAHNEKRLADWRRNFVAIRFYHVLTPLLKQLAQHASTSGLPTMYAYIRDGYLFVVGLDRNKLQFCNVFVCKAAKDFLYYLLLAYEQCGWKTNKVALKLFGEVVAEAEIYKLFYRYIKDVEFLKDESSVKWGDKTGTS